MGYYCTVPQCTSLAGKTKNVKFHRFPRDKTMADSWNVILKRGKPYTKYSKVCSLHFTQNDYNVTTMGKNKGQWKTLSKDAVPSQNLPKLNPDGTVMVIRKSRTVKYKEGRKDDGCITEVKQERMWSPSSALSHHQHIPGSATPHSADLHADHSETSYRLHALNAIANHISPVLSQPLHATTITPIKPKKQDAIMQTDPLQIDDEDQNTQTTDEYNPNELDTYPVTAQYQKTQKNYDTAKDYTKTSDYIPQTNEEYNKEAEKYALERKSHNGYEKIEYNKAVLENGYPKLDNSYNKVSELYSSYPEKSDDYVGRGFISYPNGYPDSADTLRNQQHNLQILQEQHRASENQNFFNDNPIKQEIDLSVDDDKFLYERTKEQLDASSVYSEPPSDERTLSLHQHRQQRILEHLQNTLKQEPDAGNTSDSVMQPQGSPYSYSNGHSSGVAGGYYDSVSRPGPELLIAKQNALAAHTQLWQSSVKRPFYYSETAHYTPPIHRYEEIPRILQ